MKTKYLIKCGYSVELVQVDNDINTINIGYKTVRLNCVQSGHDCLLVVTPERCHDQGASFHLPRVKVIDLLTLDDVTYSGLVFTIENINTGLDRIKPGYTAIREDGKPIPTDGLTKYPFTRLDDGRVQLHLSRDTHICVLVPLAAITLDIK